MTELPLARLAVIARRRRAQQSSNEIAHRSKADPPMWSRPRMLGAVAAGGVIGAGARYELSLAVSSPPGTFPLATFVINVSGSFVLGALLVLILERWRPNEYVRPFVATGVLGAYTTWSTFMVESDNLIKAGRVFMAVGYLAASLVAGLLAVYVGMMLMRNWPPLLHGRDRGGAG